VLGYLLNIIGSEWIMIIFIALILLLGTNRFPDVAKKIGRLVGEYHNAKNQIQTEMKDITKENLEVSGPVKNERKKLEIMADHFGVDCKSKTDDELKKIIDSKIGRPQKETQSKK